MKFCITILLMVWSSLLLAVELSDGPMSVQFYGEASKFGIAEINYEGKRVAFIGCPSLFNKDWKEVVKISRFLSTPVLSVPQGKMSIKNNPFVGGNMNVNVLKREVEFEWDLQIMPNPESHYFVWSVTLDKDTFCSGRWKGGIPLDAEKWKVQSGETGVVTSHDSIETPDGTYSFHVEQSGSVIPWRFRQVASQDHRISELRFFEFLFRDSDSISAGKRLCVRFQLKYDSIDPKPSVK